LRGVINTYLFIDVVRKKPALREKFKTVLDFGYLL
jgi:hypothetical protein